MSTQEFRFDKRERYEQELKKMIKKLERNPNNMKIEEEYELLSDEYLKFCTEEVDGEK